MKIGMESRRCRCSEHMLQSSAVLCVLAAWMAGVASALTKDPDVELVMEKPGWERAWSHEAMEPLYRASLYPDLEVFLSRVRLPSALGIANQLKRYHMNNTNIQSGTAVIVIRAGKLQALTFDNFNPAFQERLDAVVGGLQRHQDAGHVKLQDTIFILNLRDLPLCLLGFCLVPVFSPFKEIRLGRPYSDDLLVPLMAYPQEALVYYPPEKKAQRGVMAAYASERGLGYDGCRALVQHFARQEPQSSVLSVEDTEALIKQHAGDGAKAQPPVRGMAGTPPPAEVMSKFAVVIACDCRTGNPGFASLLHTNSLVLRGRSNWHEYFYRAMQGDVHYREFDHGHVFEAVKEALKGSQQAKVREQVEAGQRFAYTYLSMRSRALYYEKAISGYNELFGQGYMQATVDGLPTDRPLTMADILDLKMYPPSWKQGLAWAGPADQDPELQGKGQGVAAALMART